MNNQRATDFARHGTNMLEVPVVVGFRLKEHLITPMLKVPRFHAFTTLQLITKARVATKDRLPVTDRATAIALILGTEGL